MLVCPLDSWMDDETLKKISIENNLRESAFFVKTDDGYDIRWFLGDEESELCSHSTIASAFIIKKQMKESVEKISFNSKSGKIDVVFEDDYMLLDFPSFTPNVSPNNPMFEIAMKERPLKILQGMDYILIYDSVETIKNIKPDHRAISKLDFRGVCITAKADKNDNFDFAYRFFVPKYGIDEDFAIGSVCSQLVPFWSQILNKNKLKVKVVSQRNADIICEIHNEVVTVKGQAKLYLEGKINI
jgi:PhzF family phenazine biosynthesis protein